MASFFRRRRSLIAKIVLTIPALWFLGVVLMNYNDVDSNGNVRKRQAASDHKAVPADQFGAANGHNDRLHAVDRGVLAQKIHKDLGGNNRGNNFMEEEKIPTPMPNKIKKKEEKPLKFIPKEQNRPEVDPNAP
ncbi:uncharacterized protein LOC132547846, partial [Ylistrum balloti]|uniref:uncharacterized protein LOC132547846 n=1 Tax=Ylistrum balloti TaxID=509963 RepID=UPI002905B218